MTLLHGGPVHKSPFIVHVLVDKFVSQKCIIAICKSKTLYLAFVMINTYMWWFNYFSNKVESKQSDEFAINLVPGHGRKVRDCSKLERSTICVLWRLRCFPREGEAQKQGSNHADCNVKEYPICSLVDYEIQCQYSTCHNVGAWWTDSEWVSYSFRKYMECVDVDVPNERVLFL